MHFVSKFIEHPGLAGAKLQDPATAIIGGVGLALNVFGQQKAKKQQKKAAKEAKRQAQLQNAQQEVENRRRRVESIREARIKRASIISAGETAGAGGSTAVAGGAGAVASTAASNIGNFSVQEGASRSAAQAGNRAISATQKAGEATAISNLGGQVFSTFGGYKTLFQNLGIG